MTFIEAVYIVCMVAVAYWPTSIIYNDKSDWDIMIFIYYALDPVGETGGEC